MLDRLAYRLLPLLLCLGLLLWLRSSGVGGGGGGHEGATMAVGFLLIGAFSFGQTAAWLGLPRITGYLAVGILAGPYAFELLTRDMLAAGEVVEGIAVALIALTAGGELRLGWLRKQAGRLLLITGGELLLVWLGLFSVALLLAPVLPFMPSDPLARAAVAVILGAIGVSNSPLVTIAIIGENRADGPVSRTVLGVTIVTDLCVVVLFAVALTVARNALYGGGGHSLGLTLLRELGGSILAGLAFGIGISWFLTGSKRDVPVFVLAVCFAIADVAQTFQLETLLVALVAGFFVENFSRAEGHDLLQGVERLSLPVYALFFAAAGAKVDLAALSAVWPYVLLFSLVRAGLIFAGARAGARLARSEPQVSRYTWLGLISQAGMSLALAATAARAFPEWGAGLQVFIVAMIAVHEIIGPIGFQYALGRAGEVGAGR